MATEYGFISYIINIICKLYINSFGFVNDDKLYKNTPAEAKYATNKRVSIGESCERKG